MKVLYFWSTNPIFILTILVRTCSYFILTYGEKIDPEFSNKNTEERWEPLEILLLKFPDLAIIPPPIFWSLVTAVRNANLMITVRNSPNDPQVSDDQILECANAHSLDDQSKSQPEYVTVEDFQPIPLSFTKSMRPDSEVNLHKFGNFFIILQTNQKICAEDAHLLAAAAPCFDSRSNHRPLLGRMVICTNNSLWSQFTSSYDLFRHEILHTLGFGMIIPDRPTSVKSKTYDWMLGSGQSIPFEAHFMDFAARTMEFAQEYFKCAEVDGIEAEDANKIHLNEYIFGNELMTPVVNEGKNYFTKFSASILEETYRGDEPWYLCNKELVEVETQQYWWGRAAGCDFLRKSCFELIHEPSPINTAAEYPKMSEVRAQIDYESPELDEEYEDIQTIYPWIEDDKADTLLMHSEQMTIPLPFCDERDLFFEVALHAPKKVCLSNGTSEMSYTVHCQILTKLKVVPENYQPITLESQFPDLVRLLNKQALNTYGSDYDHRYCPLPKDEEFWYRCIDLLPKNDEKIDPEVA